MPRSQKRHRAAEKRDTRTNHDRADKILSEERSTWAQLNTEFDAARARCEGEAKQILETIETHQVSLARMVGGEDISPTVVTDFEDTREQTQMWRSTSDYICVEYLTSASGLLTTSELYELNVECPYHMDTHLTRVTRTQSGHKHTADLNASELLEPTRVSVYTAQELCVIIGCLYDQEVRCVQLGIHLLSTARANRGIAIAPWMTSSERAAIRDQVCL